VDGVGVFETDGAAGVAAAGGVDGVGAGGGADGAGVGAAGDFAAGDSDDGAFCGPVDGIVGARVGAHPAA